MRTKSSLPNSDTHTERETETGPLIGSGFGATSGIGDCGRLGVPNRLDLGFYMWDSEKNERLEVLGAVSTEVARLELQGSNASDGAVPIIQAPNELGDERNFFYLWLPLHEVGTLVAYDAAGDLLRQELLCLKAYEPHGSACTVGAKAYRLGVKQAERPFGRLPHDALRRDHQGSRWRSAGRIDPRPSDPEVDRSTRSRILIRRL